MFRRGVWSCLGDNYDRKKTKIRKLPLGDCYFLCRAGECLFSKGLYESLKHLYQDKALNVPTALEAN